MRLEIENVMLVPKNVYERDELQEIFKMISFKRVIFIAIVGYFGIFISIIASVLFWFSCVYFLSVIFYFVIIRYARNHRLNVLMKKFDTESLEFKTKYKILCINVGNTMIKWPVKNYLEPATRNSPLSFKLCKKCRYFHEFTDPESNDFSPYCDLKIQIIVPRFEDASDIFICGDQIKCDAIIEKTNNNLSKVFTDDLKKLKDELNFLVGEKKDDDNNDLEQSVC